MAVLDLVIGRRLKHVPAAVFGAAGLFVIALNTYMLIGCDGQRAPSSPGSTYGASAATSQSVEAEDDRRVLRPVYLKWLDPAARSLADTAWSYSWGGCVRLTTGAITVAQTQRIFDGGTSQVRDTLRVRRVDAYEARWMDNWTPAEWPER